MTIYRRIGRTLCGFGYGILLGGVAILCAGFGHGTYVPVAVSSAPFGFLGAPSALVMAPLVWAVVAFLLDERNQKRQPHLVLRIQRAAKESRYGPSFHFGRIQRFHCSVAAHLIRRFVRSGRCSNHRVGPAIRNQSERRRPGRREGAEWCVCHGT